MPDYLVYNSGNVSFDHFHADLGIAQNRALAEFMEQRVEFNGFQRKKYCGEATFLTWKIAKLDYLNDVV